MRAMGAHHLDLQKTEKTNNHGYPQDKQPATHVIDPGASQKEGWQRNGQKVHQVLGSEMAMQGLMDSTPVTVF